MELENLLIILIGICALLVLEIGIMLAVVSGMNAKLKVLRDASEKTVQIPENQGSLTGRPASPVPEKEISVSSKVERQEGLVICRSCYNAIPMRSRTCPCCMSLVDGRAQ